MYGRDELKQWSTGFLIILAAVSLNEENSGGPACHFALLSGVQIREYGLGK